MGTFISATTAESRVCTQNPPAAGVNPFASHQECQTAGLNWMSLFIWHIDFADLYSEAGVVPSQEKNQSK